MGDDIAIARKKRGLPIAMMLQRTGISKSTYQRVEKGDPTVSLGIYAMVLFVLGRGDAIGTLMAPNIDTTGLLFDVERLPKRVHQKKVIP